MTFRALASLLAPVRPDLRHDIIEASDAWQLPFRAMSDADVVTWGRVDSTIHPGRPAAIRAAVARERALMRLRWTRPRRLTYRDIHRVEPTELQRRPLWVRMRKLTRGGALVQLAVHSAFSRVLDSAVKEATPVPTRLGSYVVGSGGSIIARVPWHNGAIRLMRIACEGGPMDPSNAASALTLLAQANIEQTPRLERAGSTAGASWTIETLLPGRRPQRLTTGLLRELVLFCSGLPRSLSGHTSVREDFQSVAERFPSSQALLAQVADGVRDGLAALPSVLRHGDLWPGNLLVHEGRLRGVVDWDAWHPSGVPGTDLLHAVGTEERYRVRRSFGEFWLTRPWLSDSFQCIGAPYWAELGVRPTNQILEVVGLAWWAVQIGNTLRRLPHLATDDHWLDENVTSVLAAVER